MSAYEQLTTGKKIEALSLKVNQLQQEIAGLRQDVKTILSLLQKLSLQSDKDITD
ncbi:hypothetical protein LLG46_12320 [bacterium]|nr:hypothetical protein [bacterium]